MNEIRTTRTETNQTIQNTMRLISGTFILSQSETSKVQDKRMRGIMGELQLGAFLEEILSKEQYEENVVTKKSTQNCVEFAIKLPGDDNGHTLLSINAKFHRIFTTNW